MENFFRITPGPIWDVGVSCMVLQGAATAGLKELTPAKMVTWEWAATGRNRRNFEESPAEIVI